MKSHALGALAGLAVLALGAWQAADAALCMCHPTSCLLINPDNNALNSAELNCPMKMPDITDLMIVRFASDKLAANTFASFPNLTTLEIFQGVMRDIEPGAFEKVPNLTKLIIRHNHLDTLVDDTFRGLGQLEILFIIASELTSIAPNALAGLKNLTHLTLTSNKLTQLPELMFASTPALKSLVLSNNQLGSSLPAGLFNNNDELYRLDLSNNKLTSFDFPSLKVEQLLLFNNSLTSLYLSEHYASVHGEQNRISKLYGTGSNIRTLLLSDNALTELGPIASMTNLTKLSLSSNPLQPDIRFGTLVRLDELLLSHTYIQITADTFGKLTTLKLLDLSYNNLTDIDFSMLSGLVELQTLIVAFNQLGKINFVQQREYLPKLRVLEICGNGWNQTYLERVIDHMRMYRLKADMHGLSHTFIFKATYVELCSTTPEATKNSSADDYYYSEDISDIMEHDLAEMYPGTDTSGIAVGKGFSSTTAPRTFPTHNKPTHRPIPAFPTTGLPKPSAQPSVRLIADTVPSSALVPGEQPPVVAASPLFVTFQVIVYTFAVFGLVALGVVAYYLHQRRNDVRRITVLDETDSVRLV